MGLIKSEIGGPGAGSQNEASWQRFRRPARLWPRQWIEEEKKKWVAMNDAATPSAVPAARSVRARERAEASLYLSVWFRKPRARPRSWRVNEAGVPMLYLCVFSFLLFLCIAGWLLSFWCLYRD